MDGNGYSCRIIQNNQNINVLEKGLGENLKYKAGIGGILMTGGFCFKNINQWTLRKVNLLHIHTEFYIQENNVRVNTMKTSVSEKYRLGKICLKKKIESKLRFLFRFLMEGQSLGKSARGLEFVLSENFESSHLALLH